MCTTESPFRSPGNKLFYQINGVAMGSPLGPTFGEFYMCDLENRVLLSNHLKPNSYARYVDDIFVVRNELHLNPLKMEMEAQSVLSFTFEMNINNSMSFLDVKIHKEENQYETTVFRKPSDAGKCLNSDGECLDRYKRSVIRAYLHRAHKTCSSDHLLRQETLRIKQILINNGFTNTDVDREISKFYVKPISDEQNLKLFYENKMSDAYNVDERVLKNMYYFPLRSYQKKGLFFFYIMSFFLLYNPNLKSVFCGRTYKYVF